MIAFNQYWTHCQKETLSKKMKKKIISVPNRCVVDTNGYLREFKS